MQSEVFSFCKHQAKMRSLLLLFLCVPSLWGQSPLAPANVAVVSVKARTETELLLEWNKVQNSSYILRYSNGTETPLTVSTEGPTMTHTVSSLSPGTKYTFTLYTVSKGLKSSGYNFAAVTSPPNVASVSVKARTETAITFEWRKLGSNNAYIYLLRQNKTEAYTPMYWGGSVASQTVVSLAPGTKYNFTLYTVFGGERSSGYNFTGITLPVNVARVNVTQRSENELVLSWAKVNHSNVSYILRHGNGTETPIMDSDPGSVVTHNVSSLSPGTRYSFTLYTVSEGIRSRGLNFSSVTAFLTVTGLYCKYVSGGRALVLGWDAPSGVWTGVEVQVPGRRPQYPNETRLEVQDLLPAHWYDITLRLCSGDTRSDPVSISCQTDPRALIAGAALSVLLIVLLVCLGVYINHRRQSVLNRP
ncbi:receptor-type tyrosine-protein phosphatase H-like isoform X2 [Brachyhypopomus gauderio]|uniref:receptor-type tyrosine-protein phosphatase H-like isoform X2 n=1 Tax=Brachyhypopomus gauderio TaxID=698409 RepID=UPI004043505C